MKIAMFIRGINVGGIKVPMSELGECLTELHLDNVKTFLQTGNVLFDSDTNTDELKPSIEQALSERFNYKAHVLLYPASTLRNIVDNYPFHSSTGKHRYVIFCDSRKTIEELLSQAKDLDISLEKVADGTNVIYWNVDKGRTLDAGFSKVLAKPKYKPLTTNRNVKTIEKMIEHLNNKIR